jgi:pteridine reductase
MTDPARVVLITGAARRIGAQIARTLHAAGWSVALHAHQSLDAMQPMAFAMEIERPGSVLTLQADLAQASAAEDMIEQVMAHFGRIDALVNNASNFFPTPLGQISAADFDSLMAVNARAPLLLAQAAATQLRLHNGAIVNLTDFHASAPKREHAAYCTAKAALAMVTQMLALELAPQVRVNAVAPGAILWPEEGKSEADRNALLLRTPLARLGTPAEVAEAVRWLLDDATYLTGQTLGLDGGRALS